MMDSNSVGPFVQMCKNVPYLQTLHKQVGVRLGELGYPVRYEQPPPTVFAEKEPVAIPVPVAETKPVSSDPPVTLDDFYSQYVPPSPVTMEDFGL